MADRTNRRELIINIAGNLFVQQGYNATSVRQIAKEVGVTEAALYYHFKDRKRGLLRAVFISQMPNLTVGLDSCRDAESLADLIRKYSQEMKKLAPQRFVKIRWLISEFPNFDDEERRMLQQIYTNLHKGLVELIEPFASDPTKANALAWIIICALFGYEQLFWSLDMRSVVDLNMETIFSFRLSQS